MMIVESDAAATQLRTTTAFLGFVICNEKSAAGPVAGAFRSRDNIDLEAG